LQRQRFYKAAKSIKSPAKYFYVGLTGSGKQLEYYQIYGIFKGDPNMRGRFMLPIFSIRTVLIVAINPKLSI
jgi:hypothetical protein